MRKSFAVVFALILGLLSALDVYVLKTSASAESDQENPQDNPFQVLYKPDGARDLRMEIWFTDQGMDMVAQSPCRLELEPDNGLVIREDVTDIDLSHALGSGRLIRLTLSYDKTKVIQRTDAGDIIPTLKMTLYSSSRPVCVYQAEYDATPVGRAVLVAQDKSWQNYADRPVARMEELFNQSYCSGRKIDITRWTLNAPLSSVEDMLSNFDHAPDRNDLTYIYIATHGYQGGFLLWGSTEDTGMRDPCMTYGTFFEQLSEYDGRYVIVIDACQSGSAVDVAAEMPVSSDLVSLDPNRFFVMTSMDRTTNSSFPVFSRRIRDYSAPSRWFNTTITCGELYGVLRNGTSEVLKTAFGEPEKTGPWLVEVFWGVVKGFSQDTQAYGNYDLPFFMYDQANSDMDDVPLAFLKDSYTIMSPATIDSLVLGRKTIMSDGDGWVSCITIFCVDENGHLILDVSGKQATCSIWTFNGYLDDPFHFHMRVWLLDHRYVVLELADPSIASNSQSESAVVYRVLGLDENGKLVDVASAKTNGRGGEVFCFIGNDCVRTLGSLEYDAEALRGFFLPYHIDFGGAMEQVVGTYHNISPEEDVVFYRRAFITDDVPAKLVFDTDREGAFYTLPDEQSVIDQRYQPMEVRMETENTVHVELPSGSIELTDLFLTELKGLIPDLTLTATTRDSGQEIWTEEYTTDNGCVLTITADSATGSIRSLRFDDSNLYGFAWQGRTDMYDPVVWRSSSSMQSVVDMVAASEAFGLDRSVRDEIYDTDFAGLYSPQMDEVGNESFTGSIKYDGVTVEIAKRRQVAGMEYMSSYIVFTFE